MSKTLNEGTAVEIKLPQEIKENYQLPDPTLINFYEDRHNRIIWMLGDIGEQTWDWVDFILRINREDMGIKPEKRKPIKCLISNVGGQSGVAKSLVEIIQLSQTPIYGYAIGTCASAASIIFLSCHKRYALPNAYWVFHNGSCEGLSGTYQELISYMNDYQRDIEELSEFYKTHTKFKPELIDDKLEKGDWYIYTDEALENGIIDGLVDDISMLL